MSDPRAAAIRLVFPRISFLSDVLGDRIDVPPCITVAQLREAEAALVSVEEDLAARPKRFENPHDQLEVVAAWVEDALTGEAWQCRDNDGEPPTWVERGTTARGNWQRFVSAELSYEDGTAIEALLAVAREDRAALSTAVQALREAHSDLSEVGHVWAVNKVRRDITAALDRIASGVPEHAPQDREGANGDTDSRSATSAVDGRQSAPVSPSRSVAPPGASPGFTDGLDRAAGVPEHAEPEPSG